MGLGIALKVESDAYNEEDVRQVLTSTLRQAAMLAHARCDAYRHACEEFEVRYRFSSDEFMQRFESGALGDDAEYLDWYAAKRGLDLWNRRAIILDGVSV